VTDLIEQVAWLRDEVERFHRESRDSAEQAGRAIRERDEARAEVERLRTQVSVLDSAMSTVWLHSKWRWISGQMTTEEREEAWAAVKRNNDRYDPDEPLLDRNHVWWRDTEVKP
jgi:hypothetical protein